ncbi:hypothetical protein Tco_0441986 [Tanacetum coccineum]
MATNEETKAAGTDDSSPPMLRLKVTTILKDSENKLEMADTQAEIILSQGLPRHIFNNLNQTSTAKEIWDNIEMLMQGSGRTIQQRKEDLFDEYERFRELKRINSMTYPQQQPAQDFSNSRTQCYTVLCHITRTNNSEEKHQTWMKAPMAAVAFMANLSSTSATNSQVNEVHSNDNPIFDNVDYQLNQEMHHEEHLHSDAEN